MRPCHAERKVRDAEDLRGSVHGAIICLDILHIAFLSDA
jgi:hypothetical protein